MGAREQRAERREERPPWWTTALDWLRVLARNVADVVTSRTPPAEPDPDRGIGGYPVCATCRQGQHRGCGLFDDDPPCGCTCQAAKDGRDDEEIWR